MAAHGQGVRSRARPLASVIIQMKAAATNKAAVYLEYSASPAATPTASHQRLFSCSSSRAKAAIPAVQKKISGVSGVMMMDPAPTISVAFSMAAAISPAWRCGNMRSPASISSSVPRPAEIGPNRRMPSGLSPSSDVPMRIQTATIEGAS